MDERAREFVAYTIQQELDARGWTVRELASRMGGKNALEVGIHEAAMEIFLAGSHDPGLLLGDELEAGLALAFGTSKELWTNLDRSRRERLIRG